jgi:hypothetical protein
MGGYERRGIDEGEYGMEKGKDEERGKEEQTGVAKQRRASND